MYVSLDTQKRKSNHSLGLLHFAFIPPLEKEVAPLRRGRRIS
jgi:hypothetical protein